MGRIKTSFIKNIAKDLMAKHPDKFPDDFERNKETMLNYVNVDSKKIRNGIAGHVTSQYSKVTQ
ncbi:MAG: 30S ribosomal protein S17e [Candidatus Aenigmarchaeota archaeon]|nr:30S ribosomal protein S17e [Candidatus Aenigmarchaeota archaeon]